MYKPAAPFRTAMILLKPDYTVVKGTPVQEYPKPEDAAETDRFFGTFRTFGGTETIENNLVTVVDTGYIDTWYRSDIKSDCRICIKQNGDIFEILGDPENISMANRYLKIRVRKIGGRP